MKTRAAGFTLIELMVTVVILSILAAIAIPSYRQYVLTSQRDQAKSVLLSLVTAEERYYTNNYAYYALTAAPAVDPNGWSNYVGSTIGSRTYNVSIVIGATPPTFTITATPTLSFSDAQCGSLTLTNAGLKGNVGGTVASGSSPCW